MGFKLVLNIGLWAVYCHGVRSQTGNYSDCSEAQPSFTYDQSIISYTKYCGLDIPLQDYTEVRRESFSACGQYCIDIEGPCTAFSYEASSAHASRNCYLKYGSINSSATVQQTFVMESGIMNLDAVDDCSSLGSQQTINGVTYEIFCGSDIVSDSFERRVANSMRTCIGYCADLPDCKAIAYNPSQEIGYLNCYLKGDVRLGLGTQSDRRYAAARVVTATSSSSPSSSATATTSSQVSAALAAPTVAATQLAMALPLVAGVLLYV